MSMRDAVTAVADDLLRRAEIAALRTAAPGVRARCVRGPHCRAHLLKLRRVPSRWWSPTAPLHFAAAVLYRLAVGRLD